MSPELMLQGLAGPYWQAYALVIVAFICAGLGLGLTIADALHGQAEEADE